MTMDSRRTIIRLVRVVALPLLLSVLWRSGRDVAAAYHYNLPALAALHLLVAAGLIVAALLAEVSLRRYGITFFRAGVFVLIAACACSLALGNSPGLFLSSVLLSALAALVLAFLSAAVSGPSVTFASRASLVLFSFAVGAAWQVGAMPVIATLVVRP